MPNRIFSGSVAAAALLLCLASPAQAADPQPHTNYWEFTPFAGFMATSNRAPQTWIVRVVLIGSSGVTVQDVEVVPRGRGEAAVEGHI